MVHFVNINVTEPHPEGSRRTNQYSSGILQPTIYDERVAIAKQIEPLLGDRQLLLVDDLTPGQDNPVWCTYGPCPNCAFLIGQEGIIHEVQLWSNTSAMKTAIDALLSGDK